MQPDPLSTLRASLDPATETTLRVLLSDLGEAAGMSRFRVAPNPCVGAAVLSAGVEIGRGFHEVWGGPHAEIHALEAAAASGIAPELWDTLVVTLEPCSTFGKTPPCTAAILASGIRRIVVGETDPDPRHRGRGLALLQEAGLDVHFLRGASPLREFSPHFATWTSPERIRRARPWTLAKWAQTRTGQLTPPESVGQGRWISCQASLDEVQLLRGSVDAIVTGIGTMIADDPRLTVRAPGDRSRPPLRVVLDSDLRLSSEARLFAPFAPGEVGGAVHVLARAGASAVSHRELVQIGATIQSLHTGDDGELALREVQSYLWGLGVRRVLLEAGPTLLESYFRSELVDQVAVYTGNVNGGRGPFLGERLRPATLRDIVHRECGEDAVLEAFRR